MTAGGLPAAAAALVAEVEAAETRAALRRRVVALAREFLAAPALVHDELLVLADRLTRAEGADVFDALLERAVRRAVAAPAQHWPQVRAGLEELLESAPSGPQPEGRP